MKLFLLLCTSSTLVFGEILANGTEHGELSFSGDKELSTADGDPSTELPGKCPESMEPYPTSTKDSKTLWGCRCKPRYLYFPSIDSCHEAYRQGPCPPGQYVNRAADGTVTRCIENPCSTDGLVPYNGGCHVLGASDGICAGFGILGVDDNFQLLCQMIVVPDTQPLPGRQTYVIDAPSKPMHIIACPLGTMRAANGDCLTILI